MKIISLLTLVIMSFSSLANNEQFLTRADAYEDNGSLYVSNEIMISTDRNNKLVGIYHKNHPRSPIKFNKLITRPGTNQVKSTKLKMLFVTIVEISAQNFSLENGGDLKIIIPSKFRSNNKVKSINFSINYNKQSQRWQVTQKNNIVSSLVLNLDKNMNGATFLTTLFSPPKIKSTRIIELSCSNKEQYLEDTNDLYSVEELNCNEE